MFNTLQTGKTLRKVWVWECRRIGPSWASQSVGASAPRLDLWEQQAYFCFMLIESIREFNRASPFAPYEIRTVSGQRYPVPHPDFILIAPRGNYVIVVDANNRPHHLSALFIERASPIRNIRRRATKKRAA